MNKNKGTSEATKKLWISTSGYRILLLLKSLLEKSYTIKELMEIVQNNPVVGKSVSIDTMRADLQTLKAAGCKFAQVSKANHYKYELISHPFVLDITDKELSSFLELREKYASKTSAKNIFVLNSLYSKISALTFNSLIIELLKNTKPLLSVDEDVFNQITNPRIMNRKVRIIYNSPEYKNEEIDIIPQKVVYENDKIYMWCYNYKYSALSLLNVERIIKIISVDINNTECPRNSYDVTYEVTGEALQTFKPQENEKILERHHNRFVIKAVVDNEFIFIQRILQFGGEFKIISPDFFKEKLINKIKLIQKGYSEND